MFARMPTTEPRRSVSVSNQVIDDIGNREKKETKLNLGDLGKVAPNYNNVNEKCHHY